MIDLQYLAKLKQSGHTELQIAQRLGTSIEAVREAWAELKKVGAMLTASGYEDLKAIHTNSCLQFQELGKTLGVIGFALGNQIRPDELRGILRDSEHQPDPVAFVMSKCIILRPYVPTEIDQQMQEYISRYHAQAAQTDAQASGKN